MNRFSKWIVRVCIVVMEGCLITALAGGICTALRGPSWGLGPVLLMGVGCLILQPLIWEGFKDPFSEKAILP